MFSVVLAEALKLSRHPSIWFLVWIYPIWAVIAVVFQVLTGLSPGHQPPAIALGAEAWARQTSYMLQAPLSGVGRILIAGFAAVVFAGEYGWNTWKLVIPARSRAQLILAKWLVAFALLAAAFVTADLISLAGSAAAAFLTATPLPAGLSAGMIIQTHMALLIQGLVPILSTLVLASLIAVLTRAVLPTVMVSIGAVLIEPMLTPIALWAGPYAPGLVEGLLKVLPFYHSANLEAAAKGSGLVLLLGQGERLAFSPQTSLLALWAWTIAAGGLALYRFGRDDHN
jgi:ABC-2 type transport system permease protein